jgi:3-oxoadipate enol-lactonase
VLRLADGARIAFRVDGPAVAPALVLVNALGTDMRLWEPQVDRLRNAFCVIRHDMRGHGESSPPAGPLTIDLIAHDLLMLLDHLDIRRTHLCGLSLGGMAALRLAAAVPERVDRLVLANTGLRIGTAELWDERMAAVRKGGMPGVLDIVLARCLTAGFRARRPDVAQLIVNMLEAVNPEGYIAACTVLRDTDLRSTAGSVRAPSLIIAGRLDQATPPLLAAELRSVLPNSHVVTLDAAHLSSLEQPAAFARHVERHLGAIERAMARRSTSGVEVG